MKKVSPYRSIRSNGQPPEALCRWIEWRPKRTARLSERLSRSDFYLETHKSECSKRTARQSSCTGQARRIRSSSFEQGSDSTRQRLDKHGSEQGQPDRQPNVQLASEAEEPRAQTCKRGNGGTTGASRASPIVSPFPTCPFGGWPGGCEQGKPDRQPEV